MKLRLTMTPYKSYLNCSIRYCYGFVSKIQPSVDDFYLQKYKQIINDYYQIEYEDRIPGYTTKEGCQNYITLRSRGQVNEKHFRTNYHNQLKLSSLGIGTHLGTVDKNDDTKLFGSLIDSIASGGVNHIDTDIHYREMRSERTIGAALRFLFENTAIQRNELFIASKIGYIPSDSDKGTQASALKNKLIKTGMVKEKDIAGDCHCMTPKFLESQLEQSLSNLGLETLDLVYLLNSAEHQLPLLGREQFELQLAKSFEFFEKQVSLGRIRNYGLATWICFRVKPDDTKLYLSLQNIVKIAEKVGGKNHHMRYIQTPINIMMPETFAQEWQELEIDGQKQNVLFLSAARQLKINVVSSSPLMNGQLIQVPLQTSVFKCQNQGAKHLQFIRSIPAEALKTTLVGQKCNQHTKTNLEVIKYQPLSPEEFWAYLKPQEAPSMQMV